jgi:dienelactone hydrolase
MADIRSEVVSYTAGGVEMKGYLAWDAEQQGPRPGVLVAHEWWGCNEYSQRRARMLAEAGYTGLALDLYGDGRIAANPSTSACGTGCSSELMPNGVNGASFSTRFSQLQASFASIRISIRFPNTRRMRLSAVTSSTPAVPTFTLH